MLNQDISKFELYQNLHQKVATASLTEREREYIFHVMQNKPIEEITKNMGITPETAYFYWANISRKLASS